MEPVKLLFESFMKVKRNPDGVTLEGLDTCVEAPVTETEFPDTDILIYVTAEN